MADGICKYSLVGAIVVTTILRARRWLATALMWKEKNVVHTSHRLWRSYKFGVLHSRRWAIFHVFQDTYEHPMRDVPVLPCA